MFFISSKCKYIFINICIYYKSLNIYISKVYTYPTKSIYNLFRREININKTQFKYFRKDKTSRF